MNPLQHEKVFNFTKKNKKKTTFKCELCLDKKVYYFSKNSLKVHKMRTHKSQNKIKCDKCEKEFTRKDVLNNHVKSYHTKKKYSCLECNEAFTKKGLLIHHFQSLHLKSGYSTWLLNRVALSHTGNKATFGTKNTVPQQKTLYFTGAFVARAVPVTLLYAAT